MRQPSLNRVSFAYGVTAPPYSASNPHSGTDYSYYPDHYWYAPEQVKVTLVTNGRTCGKQVDFQSLDGKRKYRGCHSSEVYVTVGQVVPEGFRMAKMGATGLAQGAHLHLVMWVNGTRVDPYKTIESLKGKGDNMVTKDDVGPVRIVMSEVEGWDGASIHAGKHDAMIMGSWVGKKWPDFITHAWTVQKTHRVHLIERIKALEAENAKLKASGADPKAAALLKAVKEAVS